MSEAGFLADLARRQEVERKHVESAEPKTVGRDFNKVLTAMREKMAAMPPDSPEDIAARAAAEAARIESEKRSKYHELVQRAGTLYHSCRLTNYAVSSERQKAVLAAMIDYAKDIPARIAGREGVLLYGPVGTGKDHLAFAICHAAIARHNLSVGWRYGRDLFGEVRDRIGTDSPEAAIINSLLAYDLLVLSDPLSPMAGSKLTDHQADTLYRVVQSRYAVGKPTICTANVADSNEAHQRIGVATWDRLRHNAWVAFCYWDTARKPKCEIGVPRAK